MHRPIHTYVYRLHGLIRGPKLHDGALIVDRVVRYTDSGFSTTQREAAKAQRPLTMAQRAELATKSGCCSYLLTGTRILHFYVIGDPDRFIDHYSPIFSRDQACSSPFRAMRDVRNEGLGELPRRRVHRLRRRLPQGSQTLGRTSER